jgi:hypothetical protein
MRNFFAALLALLGIGTASADPSTGPQDKEPITQNLRSMVFALKPSEIGLDQSNYSGRVWGLVMETGMDSGFYTLVVLGDGTTSLYFSTGGGIIGAGEHAAVRRESAKFLELAETNVGAASPTDVTPPPPVGQTTFYFLTFDGTKSYSAKELELGEQRDKLSELFHEAHAVIASVREAQQ